MTAREGLREALAEGEPPATAPERLAETDGETPTARVRETLAERVRDDDTDGEAPREDEPVTLAPKVAVRDAVGETDFERDTDAERERLDEPLAP